MGKRSIPFSPKRGVKEGSAPPSAGSLRDDSVELGQAILDAPFWGIDVPPS
jgi:hypothetical protein